MLKLKLSVHLIVPSLIRIQEEEEDILSDIQPWLQLLLLLERFSPTESASPSPNPTTITHHSLSLTPTQIQSPSSASSLLSSPASESPTACRFPNPSQRPSLYLLSDPFAVSLSLSLSLSLSPLFWVLLPFCSNQSIIVVGEKKTIVDCAARISCVGKIRFCWKNNELGPH